MPHWPPAFSGPERSSARDLRHRSDRSKPDWSPVTTVRRCIHFVPGASEKMLSKALATEADGLVLDLEDAVAPDHKDTAREVVSSWLADVAFGRQERLVRLNAIDTPWFGADLEATMVHPPDTYLIPKVNSGDDIRFIDGAISSLEAQYGHESGGVKLVVLGTETPQGLQNIGRHPLCRPGRRIDLGSRRPVGRGGRQTQPRPRRQIPAAVRACPDGMPPVGRRSRGPAPRHGLRGRHRRRGTPPGLPRLPHGSGSRAR